MNDIFARIAALHRRLSDRPDYRRLTTARTDAEAVEGSLDMDTIAAAIFLRRVASLAGDAQIHSLQLSVVREQIEKLIGRPVDLTQREAIEAKLQQERLEAYVERHGKPPSPRRLT